MDDPRELEEVGLESREVRDLGRKTLLVEGMLEIHSLFRMYYLFRPRLSYVSKREGCCELQTGLHPPNDLLSVRKRRKRPHTRSFPEDIRSKLDISV